jgi:hypothetical protein
MSKIYSLIICLLSLVCIVNAQQWDGLTLIAAKAGGGGGGGSTTGTLKLVDTNGATIKSFSLTGGNEYSSYLTKGGNFYRTCKPTTTTQITGGGVHGRIQKINWNGNVVWDWTYSSATYVLHHDYCVLPNGNIFMIAYDQRAAGSITAIGGTYTNTVKSEKIIEVQPTGATTGNIVWEWYLWDRFCQSTNNGIASTYVSSIVNNPQRLSLATVTTQDFAHINGIDFDTARNQIILSSHFLDEVYVIDHSTTTAEAAGHTGGTYGKGGDFLYRYGNTPNYAAGGTAVNSVIHDGHLVTTGPMAGYIGFFHNQGVSTSVSCADYIALPRVGNTFSITAGQAYTPTTYTKRFLPNSYSSNMGSTEEYPNGNVMISVATTGNIIELDSNNNILWTYNAGGTCAQAHRYKMCDISTAPPAAPIINITGSTLSITTPASNKIEWYYNGVKLANDSLPTLNAGTNYGNYSVMVMDTFYCKSPLGSKAFLGADAIPQLTQIGITCYPNPAHDALYFTYNNAQFGNATITVFDMQGKVVVNEPISNKVNISNLSNGQYVLAIKNNGNTIAQQNISKQ